MKRQSKAEEALRKQVKMIQGEMDKIETAIEQLKSKQAASRFIREQIEAEINLLYTARVEASKRNKG